MREQEYIHKQTNIQTHTNLGTYINKQNLLQNHHNKKLTI